MSLHLISVILFQQQTGTIVHIPGKLVPTVIAFLAQHLDDKAYLKLIECQKLVSDRLRSVVGDDASPDNGGGDDDTLNSLLTELKELALTKTKKTVTAGN